MQFIELPSPYGDCEESADYLQSRCLRDCISNYVIKNCNCKHVYMSGENKIYLFIYLINRTKDSPVSDVSRTIFRLTQIK